MMASVNDEWRDVGKINSSRDMMPGEKVNAHAFNNNTGEKLDSVELTPQRNQLGVHRWPYYFAMLINESTYMRAGSRETGSAIKPEWSGYRIDYGVKIRTYGCLLRAATSAIGP